MLRNPITIIQAIWQRGVYSLALLLWGFLLFAPHCALAQSSKNDTESPDDQSVVRLYSMRQPYLINPLLDMFTQQTGITVQTAFLGDKLMSRLLVERENASADLVITSNFHTLYQLSQENLLRAVADQSLIDLVPKGLADPNGRWFALTQRARLIYVANRYKNDITRYEDLADPRWQGRFCTRPFSHGYNLALIASYYQQHRREKTIAWLKGMKDNLAQKPSGNDRAQVKAIMTGVCDVAIGNSYYYWLMKEDPEQRLWADAVTPIFPEQANGGTHVNVSGMAMLKGSQNKENALRLMVFLLSPKAQEFYANENREFPVNPDATLEPPLSQWRGVILQSSSVGDSAQYIKIASDLVDVLRLDY